MVALLSVCVCPYIQQGRHIILSEAWMAVIIALSSNSLMLLTIILVFISFLHHLQGHICLLTTIIIVIKSGSPATIDPLSATLTPQTHPAS